MGTCGESHGTCLLVLFCFLVIAKGNLDLVGGDLKLA